MCQRLYIKGVPMYKAPTSWSLGRVDMSNLISAFSGFKLVTFKSQENNFIVASKLTFCVYIYVLG